MRCHSPTASASPPRARLRRRRRASSPKGLPRCATFRPSRCTPEILSASAFVQASPARSARGGDGLRRASDHDGLVHGGRIDLEDLEVVGAVELVVHDPRRLQDAIALAEGVLAVALVDELDPAVQHVEHLEVAVVLVQAGRVQLVVAGRFLLDPDRVSPELAVRGLLDAEVAEGVDDPGDARIVETAQMEAADDGVNPGNPGEADGVAADTDDAAVRARRDHDEAAVAHVGHQGLLADERVLEELALLLDAEVRRNGLPLLGGVHLPREPEPFGDRRRLGDQPHVDLVPLDLVAGQAATIDPALPALLPARPEVIDAAVERQIAAEPPAPSVQEAGQPAPVVAVTVGEGERVSYQRNPSGECRFGPGSGVVLVRLAGLDPGP